MKIGAITCALVTLSLPAFAQGSRTSLGVMHEYVAADLVSAHVPIPDNLQVDVAYRPLLEWMLERSPTFRRQCVRVASNPGLTVRLYSSGSFLTGGARAITRFVRGSGGNLDAEISMLRFDDDVELIAHEIEHVIEQLDGIDLSSLADLPDTGVHRTLSAGVTFETARAARTGLRVAREVRASRQGD